jgi:hypothetical protein
MKEEIDKIKILWNEIKLLKIEVARITNESPYNTEMDIKQIEEELDLTNKQ